MICPSCGEVYIEGADTCSQCGNSVADAHVQQPATPVEASLLRDKVRELSPKSPIVVSPETPVKAVLDTLVENVIGCVFVVDEQGKIVGVFSERDALRRLGASVSQLDGPISEIMTPRVNCLEQNAKIAFAVRMMDQYGHRHIPVVHDESREFEGVISARDILRFLRSKLTEAVA